MKRRHILQAGAAAGAATLMVNTKAQQTRNWKMVTTWPKDFPGLGTGANQLAKYITEMSDGQINVTVYGGGELVPPLESFDAVSSGTAELGHGAAYYWKSKSQAAQFFAAVPFGLTAQELNAWVYYGGGQQLWDDIYAEFNLKPFLAGNTGVQMGGWFNRKINSLDDLKGLVMRMPGLGAEVLKEAGATPKGLPGGEIFPALQSGAIDATEWVGPYNDLAFGFYKVAKYYYYPGWHEPGTGLECFVNLDAYNALSSDLKQAVTAACQAANVDMLSEFMARNGNSLSVLIDEHNVSLQRFPVDMMKKLKEISDDVVGSVAAGDSDSGKVFRSFANFRRDVSGWTRLSEFEYTLARS